ncbi:MAG: hypothetical protein KDD64_05395 [Bdellovibrionales bacterium]|nr:hypothetical protein [Bdellovibrionales bacterium]
MRNALQNLDRRVIYLFVILAVALPIAFQYRVTPARLPSAEKFYDVIESMDPKEGGIALVSLDFGPNTKAENEPQAKVVIEHLMRRRIPIALLTQYALAEGFLKSVPEEIAADLMREYPGEVWEYGKDWVNLGFRPGNLLFVQSLAKSKDMAAELKRDVFGTSLKNLSVFRNVKTIRDVRLLAEFTGLVGVFDTYIQFFQTEDYVPVFGHGCTSITIPEAYIYLDSGQLDGLLEGIAGAAWYSELLSQKFSGRKEDSSMVINTALGVAHLTIIFFVLFGNIMGALGGRKAGSRRVSS